MRSDEDSQAPKRSSAPANVLCCITGFALLGGAVLWVVVALLFANDTIGDWREAQSLESPGVPGPTWWDGFQHIGGIPGALLAMVPPLVVGVCGCFLFASSFRRLWKRDAFQAG